MSSSLNDILSHPDKPLFNHLKNVGDLSLKALNSINLRLDGFVEFEILRNITYLIGISHDFGKATNFFQVYIAEEDGIKKQKLKKKLETHHAFLSSIFTYYNIEQYLIKKGLLKNDYYKYLPIISFLVVKRHHGNLQNIDDEVYDFDDEKFDILEKQIQSIDFDKIEKIYELLSFDNNKINVREFRENNQKIARDINTKQKRLVRKISEENTLFYYFITLLLYSLLLDADKIDAANLECIERKSLTTDIVDKYKEKRFGKLENQTKEKIRINEIREKIYEEAISRVDEINLDNDKILSFNVPTGTGKTLTALSFALKLRERIEKEKNFRPRIIYSLPFLSIIDQNYDVFADVLNYPTTDILLKHHHLSDIAYTTENEFETTDLEENIDKSLLLIEGWNSEIIVTTFIQFFHSFISNRNRSIRKFHNMINSIVILDEVQAIPHKYWLLLKEAIKFFAEYFNAYFIFVTATQPLIFDEKKNEIKQLIKDKEEYFKKFDRVTLIPDMKPTDINSFKEEMKKDILQNLDKNFLIVANTISSSKNIYNYIKSELMDITNSRFYYLSTNIIPKERLKRIKEIKKNKEDREIIVSTQLIEAGVDIDVDTVYRDFAPLDSINQIAGRCNREFKDIKGEVRIVTLTEKEGGKKYCGYIYENFILEKTKQVFEEMGLQDPIKELKLLELNNSYFGKVNEGMSNDESKKVLNDVKELKFENLLEFKLIEKEPYKVDVFVELDENAIRLRKQYESLGEIKDSIKRRNEWLRIKNEFYNYIISVDAKKLRINKEGALDTPIIFLPKGNYDLETGFKEMDNGTMII